MRLAGVGGETPVADCRSYGSRRMFMRKGEQRDGLGSRDFPSSGAQLAQARRKPPPGSPSTS